MAASGQLPVTQDLSSLRAKLQKLLRFLREALPISNAHTVDFYTESVWEKLVDLPPETVLSALRTSAAASEARPLEEAGRMSGEWRVGGARRRALGGVPGRGSPADACAGGERALEDRCVGRSAAAFPPRGTVAPGLACRASSLPRVLLYFHNLKTTRNSARTFL